MKPYSVDATGLASNVPDVLETRPQWVPWQWGKMRKNGKREKVPIDSRTGRKAKTNDPETWSTYEEACAYARRHFMDGIGFVFSDDDPFCGVDLDDCVDTETGEVRLGADEVLDYLNTYAEISPSGTGIKVFVRAAKPGDRCNTENTPWGGKIEIYDRDRFFTVTGDVFIDAPIRDAQEELEALYRDFFPEDNPKVQAKTTTPSWGFSRDVEGQIEKARNHPDTGAMFRKYHDHGDVGGSNPSVEDWKYFRSLAYWFGGDLDIMEQVARSSAMKRPKWDERRGRQSYLRFRLESAARAQQAKGFYDPEYGKRMKGKVREIVDEHRKQEYGLREFDQRVLDYALDIAREHGHYENDSVSFNFNQAEAAAAAGGTQEQVSRALRKRILKQTPLERVDVGRQGKNSTYCLPRVSTTYAEVSTTYEATVLIGSRHLEELVPD